MLSRLRVASESLASGLDWTTSTFLRCSVCAREYEREVLSSGKLDEKMSAHFWNQLIKEQIYPVTPKCKCT